MAAVVEPAESKDSTRVDDVSRTTTFPITSEVAIEPGGDQVNAQNEHTTSTESTSPCTLDEVLIEAFRVPRDRAFILRQEKEMEDKIRTENEDTWELPLMNSYQRLLVHRIADHFHLAHSIDTSTKAVTLSRQADTTIPELPLTSMATAVMERLSEPAYAMSKDAGTSFGNFKIMRREGVGRSDSPHSNQSQGENGRKNMTIEEREAAYKEARLRIFGNEEASASGTSEASSTSTTPFSESEVKGLSTLSLQSESSTSSLKAESRKGTPGRLSPTPSSASSTTSSNAFLRAGAPSFDPSTRFAPAEYQWQQSYPYPMMDYNSQPLYYQPQPNFYGMPMPIVQHDMNGRQIIPNSGPIYLYPPNFYNASDRGSSGGPSSATSSRSTSIANDIEGEVFQTRAGQGSTIPSNAPTAASRTGGFSNRPHSLSPASSGVFNGVPHVYQGQVPVPTSWNNPSSMQSAPNNTGLNRLQQPFNASISNDGAGARGPTERPIGYAAALMGGTKSNVGSSTAPPPKSSQSNLNNVQSTGVEQREPSLNGDSPRRSVNQHERSLFDPSKPHNGVNRISNKSENEVTTTPRQSLGKSTSTGLLDGRLASSSSSSSMEQNVPSPVDSTLPLAGPDFTRRVSSSSSSNTSSSLELSRRGTPTSHPSLPARPDWVLQQKGRVSQLSNSSTNTSTSDPGSTQPP